ncbi:3D domain-containing protein [Marinobacterium marinum]|uniref:3D domain-containing protein n=1 Tax=Marinobacterium marinum TaxID=2756129 RepID=A0A7W2ADK9_9GAMM|nr:3D domain-containing protein [Marinobacterium marinum]MBA4503684.1 3D domain-containing protein [Marinobacterium marinum]
MPSFSVKWLFLMVLVLAGCTEAVSEVRTLTVQASAYNSVAAQTSATPTVAAWGDRLEPGMKAVAVSRDLLAEGLTRNTLIEIEGLPGQYRVLDKMNKRWTRKIDIYMGTDVKTAREWGVREVTIRWLPVADVGPQGE